MKVIFKKTKDYLCNNCDSQFNWNDNTLRYGKMEYKSIQEKEKIEKIFCSEKYAKDFLENEKKSKRMQGV